MSEPIAALSVYPRSVGMELDGESSREGMVVLTRMPMALELCCQIGAERC